MRTSGNTPWLRPSLLSLASLLATPAFAANFDIQLVDFQGFVPQGYVINVGDTVTFINQGGPHNVKADDGSFRCARGCDGIGTGNGNPSATVWSNTIAFNTPGVVGFHCETHGSPNVGMFGFITVQGTAPPPPPPPPSILGPGFTGAWFNPAQDGHGVFLEVLPGNLLLAAWYVFTPTAQQAWVVGVGPIVNNTASVPVQVATGARFMPNFDPAQVVRTNWGTLNFTFTNCNTGSMAYASTVAGYGSGTIPLSRVTLPAGLTCTNAGAAVVVE